MITRMKTARHARLMRPVCKMSGAGGQRARYRLRLPVRQKNAQEITVAEPVEYHDRENITMVKILSSAIVTSYTQVKVTGPAPNCRLIQDISSTTID
jgi:hypothetical protein